MPLICQGVIHVWHNFSHALIFLFSLHYLFYEIQKRGDLYGKLSRYVIQNYIDMLFLYGFVFHQKKGDC